MAQRYWPNASPIGQRVRPSVQGAPSPWITIVGVAGNVRHNGLNQSAEPELYIPFMQRPQNALFLMIRTEANIDSILEPVQQALWSVDRNLPVSKLMSMNEWIAQSVFPQRVVRNLLGTFSALAALLALIGTYAVISYSFAQRRREIGIRQTLGANRKEILRMVFRDAAGPIVLGLVTGSAAAVGVGRVLTALLYGVSPFDITTLAAVWLLFVSCSLVAVYMPARRAAGLDPMTVLGDE
jgi:ABC-type antimicrobial peptide transport system permease subunit